MSTIKDYYANALHNAKMEIDSNSESYLLGVNTDELVQYYLDKYQLPLIERDCSREIAYEKQKSVFERSSSKIPIKIFYPIIVKDRLAEAILKQSSTFYPGCQLNLEENYLVLIVRVQGQIANQERTIENKIKELENAISWKNKDIQDGNSQLKAELPAYVEEKKSHIAADLKLVEEIIKKVPVKLQKKTTLAPSPNLKIKEAIKPVYPRAEQVEELYLETDKVEAILDLLRNGGFSFETTPRVYSKLEEEELRDIMLSHLNCVFEGDATGETFVKKGKTDIHLKMSKGSILSAECKFWLGEQKYLSMIDQLLSYLTWRQNHGIMITFSRNDDFSNVIENAKKAALSHHTAKKNSFKTVDKSEFITVNMLPEDGSKTVTLHHLLFNVHSE